MGSDCEWFETYVQIIHGMVCKAMQRLLHNDVKTRRMLVGNYRYPILQVLPIVQYIVRA